MEDEVFKVPDFNINYSALSVMDKNSKLLYLFLYVQRGLQLSTESISMILGMPSKTVIKTMKRVLKQHKTGL